MKVITNNDTKNAIDNNKVVLQYYVSNDCDVNDVNSTTDDDVMYSCEGIIKNMIPIKIANLQTTALCDTGATINVLSQEFMSKIP